MNKDKIKNIAYWATTIFGPASFVIGGVLHLAQTEQVVSTLNHLGYPSYFAPILGIWKLLGAIVIVRGGMDVRYTARMIVPECWRSTVSFPINHLQQGLPDL